MTVCSTHGAIFSLSRGVCLAPMQRWATLRANSSSLSQSAFRYHHRRTESSGQTEKSNTIPNRGV